MDVPSIAYIICEYPYDVKTEIWIWRAENEFRCLEVAVADEISVPATLVDHRVHAGIDKPINPSLL
jgi:hypothetical protein